MRWRRKSKCKFWKNSDPHRQCLTAFKVFNIDLTALKSHCSSWILFYLLGNKVASCSPNIDRIDFNRGKHTEINVSIRSQPNTDIFTQSFWQYSWCQSSIHQHTWQIPYIFHCTCFLNPIAWRGRVLYATLSAFLKLVRKTNATDGGRKYHIFIFIFPLQWRAQDFPGRRWSLTTQ